MRNPGKSEKSENIQENPSNPRQSKKSETIIEIRENQRKAKNPRQIQEIRENPGNPINPGNSKKSVRIRTDGRTVDELDLSTARKKLLEPGSRGLKDLK